MDTELEEKEIAQDAGQVSQQTEEPSPFNAEEYSALNDRVANEDYEPTEEEWGRFDATQKPGEESAEATDAKETATATETKVGSGNLETNPDDAGKTDDEKAVDLVKTVQVNKMTDEQSDVVSKAMARVGAKTPDELEDKILGMQQLVSKKGGEAHEIQTKLDATQAQVDNMNELLGDLRNGSQAAYDYLRDVIGADPSKMGVAATAEAQQAVIAGKQVDIPKQDDPDDIIDPVTHARVLALEKQLLDQAAETKSHRAQFDQQNAQYEARARKQMAIGQIADQVANVANEFPDAYQVPGGNIRALVEQHLNGQGTDPRLAPVLKLMQTARDQNLPNLRAAHVVSSESSFAEALLAAEKRGRESVLSQTQSPGMSSARDSAGGGIRNETYSVADVDAMANGSRDMPDEWFNDDGSYRTPNIPAHAQIRLGLTAPQ